MKTPKDLKSVSQDKTWFLFTNFQPWSPWLTVILTLPQSWCFWRNCEELLSFDRLGSWALGLVKMWRTNLLYEDITVLCRSWLVVLVELQKEATLSSPLGPCPFGHPKPSKFRHASQPWMSSSCSSCANFRPNCASEFWSSSRQLWIIPTVGGWQAGLNQKTKASLFGCLARTLRIDGFWAKRYVWLRNSKHHGNIFHVAAIHEGNYCDSQIVGWPGTWRSLGWFSSRKRRRNGVFRIKFHFSCWRCLPKDSMTWPLPLCVEKHVSIWPNNKNISNCEPDWVVKASEQSLHKFCQCSKLGVAKDYHFLPFLELCHILQSIILRYFHP